MKHLPLEIENQAVYASFLQRLSAGFIDFLIILAILMAIIVYTPQTLTLEITSQILLALIPLVYAIFFNYKLGGTPGKLFEGIRITYIDGSKINFFTAFKRSSVDVILYALTTYLTITTLLTLDLDQYFSAHWSDREDMLMAHYPQWENVVTTLIMVWYWGELLVMLTNQRRRALHDFIANTVVINKKFLN